MRSPMRQAGFTLLEIGIVLVLSTVIVLGVFSTMDTTRKAREMARERDIAREAARAKLEGIIDEFSTNFAGLSALHNTTFPVPDTTDFPAGVVTASDPRLVLRSSVPGEQCGKILVQSSPAPLSTDLVKVTVQIRWFSTGGASGGVREANTLELCTYLSDRE